MVGVRGRRCGGGGGGGGVLHSRQSPLEVQLGAKAGKHGQKQQYGSLKILTYRNPAMCSACSIGTLNPKPNQPSENSEQELCSDSTFLDFLTAGIHGFDFGFELFRSATSCISSACAAFTAMRELELPPQSAPLS